MLESWICFFFFFLPYVQLPYHEDCGLLEQSVIAIGVRIGVSFNPAHCWRSFISIIALHYAGR